MNGTYLTALAESLEKKIEVLSEIIEKNAEQAALLKEEEFSFDKFDRNTEEKEVLIYRLNKLDDGFESLFEKVREELNENRSMYVKEIAHMQELIREITDKSSTLQAQEAENKKLMEGYFKTVRSGIGKERTSLNAAYSYMQAQRGMGGADSLYMDSKK